jgi:hypothetical protein
VGVLGAGAGREAALLSGCVQARVRLEQQLWTRTLQVRCGSCSAAQQCAELPWLLAGLQGQTLAVLQAC